mgnify:CR=1 FL=1
MTPWKPGHLAPRVVASLNGGVSQRIIMAILARHEAKGGKRPTFLERVEVTISITDDAISHMMRKENQ